MSSNGGEDGFLSRWSRRKAEAQRIRDETPDAAPEMSAQVEAQPAPQEETPFDIASLPSIDSLTADSDLSVFMQKGVPPALRDAAISRMWVADPAIRDYVGPYEMMWDFNTGEAFHGYGALAPETDIPKMMADILQPPASASPPEPPATEADRLESGRQVAETDAPGDVPEAEEVADPVEAPEATPVLPPRRRHGGASPV